MFLFHDVSYHFIIVFLIDSSSWYIATFGDTYLYVQNVSEVKIKK